MPAPSRKEVWEDDFLPRLAALRAEAAEPASHRRGEERLPKVSPPRGFPVPGGRVG